MGIVAKMNATEVRQAGGGRFVVCEEDDPGAIGVAEPGGPAHNLYTDPPGWLMGTGFVRRETRAQAYETIELTAVSMPAGDDPDKTNAQWAMASPTGKLTMTIFNPDGFGYVKAGRDYRVTIEEIRGPRRQGDES